MMPEARQILPDLKQPDQVKENSFPARCGLSLIRLYQRILSPFTGSCCRFRPSCSHYTYEAIERYGLLRGCLMGAWRILRCNPFCQGGDDPVK